jgi:hypothetical protein
MMGQWEVLDYLLMLRQTGDHSFYSPRDINKKLGNESLQSTCRKINRLYAHGYLEIEVKNWKRYFRGKINGVE